MHPWTNIKCIVQGQYNRALRDSSHPGASQGSWLPHSRATLWLCQTTLPVHSTPGLLQRMCVWSFLSVALQPYWRWVTQHRSIKQSQQSHDVDCYWSSKARQTHYCTHLPQCWRASPLSSTSHISSVPLEKRERLLNIIQNESQFAQNLPLFECLSMWDQ